MIEYYELSNCSELKYGVHLITKSFKPKTSRYIPFMIGCSSLRLISMLSNSTSVPHRAHRFVNYYLNLGNIFSALPRYIVSLVLSPISYPSTSFANLMMPSL